MNSRFAAGKKDARVRKISWNIGKEEFQKIYNDPCYYCNNLLGKISSGCGLDRVDSFKCYEINNVVPCCGFCNKLKGNHLSAQETKAAVLAIIKIRGLND